MKWKRKMLDKRRIFWTLIAVVVVVVIGLSGGLTAKYVHEQKKMDGTAAKNFYFTSDTLSEKGNTYTLSPDTTSLTIEVRNYEDELRWADTDISYEYQVMKDGNAEAKTSGTITRNAQSGTVNKITFNGLTEGTYIVSVMSIKPFQKTLTGTYVIPKASEEITTTISDSNGSSYVLVSVAVQNYTGKIILSWPKGLIPDETEDALVGTNTYENSTYSAGKQEIQVEPYSSYVYRFFKEDPDGNFSGTNEITVTKKAD